MTNVNEVVRALDARFPDDLAESWDNTGWLLGQHDGLVTYGMTALTLTEDVVDEAIANCVQMIVVHHPMMFRGVKQITSETTEGRCLLKLIQAGIAVYAPHTRFDSVDNGINAFLADRLGVADAQPLRPVGDDVGRGAGRYGVLETAIPVAEFASRVAAVCNVVGVHVVDCGSTVRRIAIACGAAGEFLDDAIRLGCDGFVVGECRFHTALQARAAGVSTFVPGHYGTERPAVEWLAESLAAEFPGVTWSASAVESDPLTWWHGDERGQSG